MTIQPVPQLDELAQAEAMFASVECSLAELREAVESLKERAIAGEEIDATTTSNHSGLRTNLATKISI